jgi:hypothetical protein
MLAVSNYKNSSSHNIDSRIYWLNPVVTEQKRPFAEKKISFRENNLGKYLEINVNEAQDIRLTIMDAMGKILMDKNYFLTQENGIIQLPPANGIYFVSVYVGDHHYSTAYACTY